jgi:hypothetical protein
MAELGDEELSFKRPVAREPEGKRFQDIGWWTDGRGYKHYGVIPKTQEERNTKTRITNDDKWLFSDSTVRAEDMWNNDSGLPS